MGNTAAAPKAATPILATATAEEPRAFASSALPPTRRRRLFLLDVLSKHTSLPPELISLIADYALFASLDAYGAAFVAAVKPLADSAVCSYAICPASGDGSRGLYDKLWPISVARFVCRVITEAEPREPNMQNDPPPQLFEAVKKIAESVVDIDSEVVEPRNDRSGENEFISIGMNARWYNQPDDQPSQYVQFVIVSNADRHTLYGTAPRNGFDGWDGFDATPKVAIPIARQPASCDRSLPPAHPFLHITFCVDSII